MTSSNPLLGEYRRLAGEPPAAAFPLQPAPADSFDLESSGTKWSSGFCGCGDDLGTCCIGYCLPSVLFGLNAKALEEEGGGGGSCATSCCLFEAIPLLCLLPALPICLSNSPVVASAAPALLCGVALAAMGARAAYTSRHRRQLRQLEGLAPEPCSDFCAHCWCPLLSMCQEAAQLKQRREARLMGLQHAVVQPPQQQYME